MTNPRADCVVRRITRRVPPGIAVGAPAVSGAALRHRARSVTASHMSSVASGRPPRLGAGRRRGVAPRDATGGPDPRQDPRGGGRLWFETIRMRSTRAAPRTLGSQSVTDADGVALGGCNRVQDSRGSSRRGAGPSDSEEEADHVRVRAPGGRERSAGGREEARFAPPWHPGQGQPYYIQSVAGSSARTLFSRSDVEVRRDSRGVRPDRERPAEPGRRRARGLWTACQSSQRRAGTIIDSLIK